MLREGPDRMGRSAKSEIGHSYVYAGNAVTREYPRLVTAMYEGSRSQ